MKKGLIKDYIINSADEFSSEAFNLENKNKVFNEIISLKVVEEFLLSQKQDLINISYEIDEEKSFYFRKELFYLNYLKVNDYQLSVLPIFEKDKIFLSRKLINSIFLADFYVFVFLDINKNNFDILGFVSSDQIIKNYKVFNNDLYMLDIKNLEDISSFIDIIRNKKLEPEYFLEPYQLKNEQNILLEEIKNEVISENFIDDIDLLNNEIYYQLLYSEDLSHKYIKLQKQQYIFNIKENNLKVLFSFNRMNSNNRVIKRAVAGTKYKITIKVLEVDVLDKNLKISKIQPAISIDDEDKTLTIKHLNEYNNKNWLLLISEDEKDINEVFREWGTDTFIEKYKNDFYYGSKDENDTITNGYLDIKLNTELPLNITILLAIII